MPHVVTRSPASPAGDRIAVGQRVVEVDELEPGARGLLHHERQPCRPLVPPDPEQLGVQGAHAQPAVGHPHGDAGDEVRSVARGLLGRARRVVDRAVVGPRVVVARGAVVVVAVGGVRRVAARRPHEVHRRAIDGHEQRPGLRGQRAQVARIARAEDVGEVDARRVHAGLFQQPVQPRRVGALGQPEAAVPAVAEAPAVRLDPGAHLQAHAGVGGQQRQDGVRRAAGPRRERRERGQEVLRQPLQRGRVLDGRTLELGRHRGVVGRLDVEGVRRRAHVAQEGPAAVQSAGRLELVAQHGRQRQGDRGARAQHDRGAAGRTWRSPPTATPRRRATSDTPST